MKSPYTHMTARDVQRLDMILLDGLSHCKAPASTDAVIEISDPRGFAQLDTERVIHELTLMISEGFVVRSDSPSFHDRLAWEITDKGRAHLIASETRNVIQDVARHTPVRTASVPEKPRIEEVPQLDLNARLRASHAMLDKEGVAPAKPVSVATVCLEEDELDEWFTSLDVQTKAGIFCEFSLANAMEETGDRRIPVLGTVGDVAPATLGQVVATRVGDPLHIGGAQ